MRGHGCLASFSGRHIPASRRRGRGKRRINLRPGHAGLHLRLPARLRQIRQDRGDAAAQAIRAIQRTILKAILHGSRDNRLRRRQRRGDDECHHHRRRIRGLNTVFAIRHRRIHNRQTIRCSFTGRRAGKRRWQLGGRGTRHLRQGHRQRCIRINGRRLHHGAGLQHLQALRINGLLRRKAAGSRRIHRHRLRTRKRRPSAFNASACQNTGENTLRRLTASRSPRACPSRSAHATKIDPKLKCLHGNPRRLPTRGGFILASQKQGRGQFQHPQIVVLNQENDRWTPLPSRPQPGKFCPARQGLPGHLHLLPGRLAAARLACILPLISRTA